MHDYLQNQKFVEKYIGYLFSFTEPVYLDSFFASIDSALTRREHFIQREFKDYSFDVENLKNRARNIHALLPAVNNGPLRAFTEGEKDDKIQLKAANYHPLPLEIIGYGSSPKRIAQTLKQPLFLPAFQKHNPLFFGETEVPATTKVVFYRVPGLTEVYHTRLSPWETAGSTTPVQETFANINLVSNDVYQVGEDVIRFKSGKHTIDSDIIIPADYVVEFPAGTELNFINQAKFLSKSPVLMMGESENPILIQSEDKSANGFTVMEANGSKMNWVRFENFNTLSTGGWNLTGAVTFYEADVNIRHCAFLRNHCEDGLNIIRSKFTLSESLISETAFDGFDADFCKGTIINSRFVDLGNDGMDFSGSVITVKDCEVENAGDKGLSVGEQSDVQVTTLKINGAVTGVASKDLSFLKIDRLELSDCNTGFAAYQKKPEYGGAKILVKDFEAKQVKYLHLIENSSFLSLKGRVVKSN